MTSNAVESHLNSSVCLYETIASILQQVQGAFPPHIFNPLITSFRFTVKFKTMKISEKRGKISRDSIRFVTNMLAADVKRPSRFLFNFVFSEVVGDIRRWYPSECTVLRIPLHESSTRFTAAERQEINQCF